MDHTTYPRPTSPLRERIPGVLLGVLLAAGGIVIIREGLTNPGSTTASGTSMIITCEEHVAAKKPIRVVVHVPGVPDGLTFEEPRSYLRFVREACASHALVRWAAGPGRDGRPEIFAFEREDVPGGFTEEEYRVWWKGRKVLWIAIGVGVSWVALAIALTRFRLRGRRDSASRA